MIVNFGGYSDPKTWRVSRDTHLFKPTDYCITYLQGWYMGDEVRAYLTGGYATKEEAERALDDAREIALAPTS